MHALRPFRLIEAEALTLSGYGRLLGAIERFHRAVHDCARIAGIAAHSSAPRRLALLGLDLEHLEAPTQPMLSPQKTRSIHAAFGWLYVAEGSMLGGRIIASQLDYLLGSGPEGRRFFLGTQEDARSWRRLTRLLDDLDPGEDEMTQMVSGAEAAFAAFEARVMEV